MNVHEVIDFVEATTHAARQGPRHGVTEREAYLYDKGFDDALRLVRSTLNPADPEPRLQDGGER